MLDTNSFCDVFALVIYVSYLGLGKNYIGINTDLFEALSENNLVFYNIFAVHLASVFTWDMI